MAESYEPLCPAYQGHRHRSCRVAVDVPGPPRSLRPSLSLQPASTLETEGRVVLGALRVGEAMR